MEVMVIVVSEIIPTGAFIPPNTNYSRSTCYMSFDGDVINDYFVLSYSYGNDSPDIIGPSYSKNVHRTGIVLGNTNGSVIDSYGRRSPNTYYDNNVWIVYSGGYVSHEDNFNVRISYGRRSPSTRSTSASYVHFVYSYGDVTGYGEYNFPDYSYGYIFDYFCI